MSAVEGGQSLTPAQIRSCLNKCRYKTETKALSMAAKCMKKRPCKTLRVYDCRYCGGWHLTEQAKRTP